MAKEIKTYPNGFKVEELKAGSLYECRVSKRIVLVVAEENNIGFAGNNKKELNTRGLVHNNVTGNTETFTPVDYQLKFPSE